MESTNVEKRLKFFQYTKTKQRKSDFQTNFSVVTEMKTGMNWTL